MQVQTASGAVEWRQIDHVRQPSSPWGFTVAVPSLADGEQVEWVVGSDVPLIVPAKTGMREPTLQDLLGRGPFPWEP